MATLKKSRQVVQKQIGANIKLAHSLYRRDEYLTNIENVDKEKDSSSVVMNKPVCLTIYLFCPFSF